jgi:dTDP-4-dehydrorhamnose reductase
MKVLITGANGMVARAAIAHCRSIGDIVSSHTRAELDISSREHVFATLAAERPNAILNCAAYTNVDGAETDEHAAYAANAAGPENLAIAAAENGAKLITISTDYVFDGTKDGFYTEEDTPNPQSAYARSKYEGELRAVAANPETIVVRSGWIYGDGGTNFLSVLPEIIGRGEPFKAIDDSYGTPTFAGDLAVFLRESAEAEASGVFHATNSGPGCSYFDFARMTVELLNADAEMIQRVSDAELKRSASRPRNSRLRSVRIESFGLRPLREWRGALTAFLNEKGPPEAAHS